MPSVDILHGVAMLRIQSAVAFISFVALATPDRAIAQAGCQPTIMQPCANAPARASNPAPNQKRSLQADEDNNASKDHSPRIKLDRDTDFKFGTGGIGIGRKF